MSKIVPGMSVTPESIRARVQVALGDWWAAILPGSLVRRLVFQVEIERSDAETWATEDAWKEGVLVGRREERIRCANELLAEGRWPRAAEYLRTGRLCTCSSPRTSCPNDCGSDCPQCVGSRS